jgi:hypothetical protein
MFWRAKRAGSIDSENSSESGSDTSSTPPPIFHSNSILKRSSSFQLKSPVARDPRKSDERILLDNKDSKKLKQNPFSIDGYGKHVFRGAVAAPYLEMVGLKPNTLETVAWTTNLSADKVAAAILHWAIDNGASVYCHWFQPLAAGFVRHGMRLSLLSCIRLNGVRRSIGTSPTAHVRL